MADPVPPEGLLEKIRREFPVRARGTMKVTLYCDIWPGIQDYGYIHASNNPGSKSPNVTRYAFEVEFPDPNKPDVVFPAVVPVEVQQ